MNKNIKRIIATSTASAVLIGGVGMSANPALASDAPSTSVSSRSSESQKFTAEDWREVSSKASSAGDTESASVASEMASKVGGNQANTYGLSGAAKKAAIAMLKYGKDKLPASIRPHADKIVTVLEEIDNLAEAPIAAGLQQAGMDPLTAANTAQQVVLWLSIFGPI